MTTESDKTYHFMYVLECADGTLYTGYSTDVEQRVSTHNSGKGAKYTASRLPVKLLASAKFQSKHEAMSAEYHFKKLDRAEKLELLDSVSETVSFEQLLTKRFALSE